MERYAIYLRKSRADIEAESRGEMETLARHEKALLDLAHKMNLPIEQIYKEIVSGDTISERPVMQHLLAEVEQGMWTGVLVMEIERLARGDTIDQGIVSRAFKMGETKIITPIKTFDPNDEYDEEYFEFGLFMSRREYKTINRRIQRGRVASVKEGKFITSIPPYGFDRVKIKGDKGYTLEPNENEAKVVKLIFDLYNQGKGMSIIAKELDNLNIKPRHCGLWSTSTISDILQNPVYIGKIRWSYRPEKKIVIDGETKKSRNISHNYICVDGIHSAIIDKAVFEKAQSMRKLNTHQCTKSDLSLKNPLAGIFYCKKCGSLMNRLCKNKHNPYDILRCTNKRCDNISAPLFLIEQKLIKYLNIWLSDYEIKIHQNLDKDTKDYQEVLRGSIKQLKKDIGQLERQISQTYDLLEREVYSVDMFRKRNKELVDKKEALICSLNNLEQRQINWQSNLAEQKHLAQNMKLLSEYSNIESAQEKNQILKHLVARVEYLKTEPNRRGFLHNDNFELYIYPLLSEKHD